MSFSYEFLVDYSCKNCVDATNRLLASLENVESYHTDLLNKTATVTLKEYADPEELRVKLNNIKPTELISTKIPYNLASPAPFEMDFEFPLFLDDRDIQRVAGYLGRAPWLDYVYAYPSHDSCRFRVFCKPQWKVKSSDIDEYVKYYENSNKIKHILGEDKLLYLRIFGLQSEIHAHEIDMALSGTVLKKKKGVDETDERDEYVINYTDTMRAYIKHKFIDYSTQSVLITANIEEDKLPEFIKVLNEDLKNNTALSVKYPGISLALEPISSPANNHSKFVAKRSTFFKRALLNVIFSLSLMALGAYIPLPLTLLGQLVGVGLGGMALSLMWKTGGEFYREAWTAFKSRRSFNMYTLITLGTGSAWVYSMMLALVPGLFPVAALQYHFLAVNMILAIINFGKGIRVYVEERTGQVIRSKTETMARNQPQVAKRVTVDTISTETARLNNQHIRYTSIKEGDIILVDLHEKFHVEGVLISDSETTVEQSVLTGETGLCYKTKDHSVCTGSLNTKNAVLIRATCDGSKGRLSRVLEEVEKSESSPPAILRLVDKIANIFVPTIIGIAALSALGWLLWNPALMINSVMSILLCACPCALALAVIPITMGANELFKHDILVRDSSALESLAKVDTVIWDKTGTLTIPSVEEYLIDRKYGAKKVIKLAASLERQCMADNDDHPIARSFINKNGNSGFCLCESTLKCIQGVSGIVINDDVRTNVNVGSLSHMREQNIEILPKYINYEDKILDKGMTAIYIAIDGKCVGVVGLKHKLREDAEKSINDLRTLGITVYLLTGDKKEPALDIARKLNIPEMRVNYEMSPEDKQKFVNELKDTGRILLGIGDGFNDLPFLRTCDVSAAVGSWTCAAGDSQLAFKHLNVATSIIIARETMKNIRQNLFWTGFYNLISLATAICGFLNPVIASISMAFSSVFVIGNSSRLLFEISHQLKMHEDKTPRPATWWEKLKSVLSLNTFLQTIEMFLNIAQDKQQTISSNDNSKSAFASALINNPPRLSGGSPSKPPSPEFVIEYNPQRRNPRVPLSAVSLVERFNGASHRP